MRLLTKVFMGIFNEYTIGYIIHFQISFTLQWDSIIPPLWTNKSSASVSRSKLEISRRASNSSGFPLFFTVVRTLDTAVYVTVTYVKVERHVAASWLLESKNGKGFFARIFPRSPIVTPNPANLHDRLVTLPAVPLSRLHSTTITWRFYCVTGPSLHGDLDCSCTFADIFAFHFFLSFSLSQRNRSMPCFSFGNNRRSLLLTIHFSIESISNQEQLEVKFEYLWSKFFNYWLLERPEWS